MKQLPSVEGFDSLQNIYSEVIADRAKDPVEQILVLTYEFDDQQLLNLVSGRSLDEDYELRQNDLKLLSDLRPVILYDARKTKESNQLPHFLDLFPIKPRAFCCHHAKAYLIITQKTVRLVLGSMNLTRTGLFANREVFQDFVWSREKRAEIQVLSAFTDLLRKGYPPLTGSANFEAVSSVLETLDARLKAWEPETSGARYTLVASGYAHQSSGIEQLKKLWDTVSDNPPTRVFVVSPFFDKSANQDIFTDLLNKHIGDFPELILVTDQANVGNLSKKHYGTHCTKREFHWIVPGISDSERVRIQKANDGVSISDLNIVRKLHAKILILTTLDRSLVYMGSANFTCKAWNGDNQELGLAWVELGDPEKLISAIMASLQANSEDMYDKLPDSSPATIKVEDDEGYQDEAGYPDFLQEIILNHIPDSESVQFEFRGDLLRLYEYEIRWSTLPLQINGGYSQEIKAKEFFSRLVGGRNLAFVPKALPERVFYLPFRHSAELFSQRDLLLFPTSEDWLNFYLGLNAGTPLSDGEFMPGEGTTDSANDTDCVLEVDRNSNMVIKMQSYLNLFSRVEKEFSDRAKNIPKAGNERERQQTIQKTIIQPLETYCKILDRERPDGEAAFLFKMGELILFCKSLAGNVPEIQEFIKRITDNYLFNVENANSLQQQYINFCGQEV